MLVLSRFVDEQIVIGHPDGLVTVSVVEVRGDGKVRLGIVAPESVTVHRREVWDRIYDSINKSKDVQP